MKVVGFALMLCCLVMGVLIDRNLLPVSTEVAVFSSFSIFLVGVYILCITKDK